MKSTLADEVADTLATLSTANQAYAARYPGDRPDRQPVHTVYGGAQLYQARTTQRLGELALKHMNTYGQDPFDFARALGLPGSEDLPGNAERLAGWYEKDPEAVRAYDSGAWLALAVHRRVVQKLKTEAVEDFRIDFEDGYGNRPDDEEDATAIQAAKSVAEAHKAGILPPFIGIRIKPLNDELKLRSIRTLDLFVSTLVSEMGDVPPNFVVTLPKIGVPEQVTALVRMFEVLETRLGLTAGRLKMELMIELTQSILAPDGSSMLPQLLSAAEGRCTGAHFGTYDYTASCSITAAYQTMDHPVCQLALNLMKIAYGGTGVHLSDGATNVMPVGPHRGELTPEQEAVNQRVVHGAWRQAYDHIRGSLKIGYYQGWDLHPGQLSVRYAASYAFFLEGFEAAAERLRNFIEKAAQATLVGDVFDDAATGQGLLNYFLNALNCGAVTLEDLAVTGLTVAEIQSRSFPKILAGRTA